MPISAILFVLTFRKRYKFNNTLGENVANIKSQKARVITNEKARLRNQATKSALRTYMKNASSAIESKDKTAGELVRVAQSKIGTAQAKGRIHKNTAARRTSRLMKMANAKAPKK